MRTYLPQPASSPQLNTALTLDPPLGDSADEHVGAQLYAFDRGAAMEQRARAAFKFCADGAVRGEHFNGYSRRRRETRPFPPPPNGPVPSITTTLAGGFAAPDRTSSAETTNGKSSPSSSGSTCRPNRRASTPLSSAAAWQVRLRAGGDDDLVRVQRRDALRRAAAPRARRLRVRRVGPPRWTTTSPTTACSGCNAASITCPPSWRSRSNSVTL